MLTRTEDEAATLPLAAGLVCGRRRASVVSRCASHPHPQQNRRNHDNLRAEMYPLSFHSWHAHQCTMSVAPPKLIVGLVRTIGLRREGQHGRQGLRGERVGAVTILRGAERTILRGIDEQWQNRRIVRD